MHFTDVLCACFLNEGGNPNDQASRLWSAEDVKSNDVSTAEAVLASMGEAVSRSAASICATHGLLNSHLTLALCGRVGPGPGSFLAQEAVKSYHTSWMDLRERFKWDAAGVEVGAPLTVRVCCCVAHIGVTGPTTKGEAQMQVPENTKQGAAAD